MLAYARKHPELRHREMAWRMVDEDVVCLSASTIYRILKEAGLVCPWRRRSKRSRLASEKPCRANERWVTDLMQVVIAGGVYYLISFMDEYSRFIVHHELVLGMDGITAQRLAAMQQMHAWIRGFNRGCRPSTRHPPTASRRNNRGSMDRASRRRRSPPVRRTP
mgnify:CR=1 FL=1